jgi:deazaflavin-dependent oxidoreductase (nitroreductase family)
MVLMLRTPGLQRLVGRSTGLITFTGRKTGTRYTTPVTYTRTDGRVIITGHQSRTWWRNLGDQPRVELRLAGHTVTGEAHLLREEEALPDLVLHLKAQPMMARAAGVAPDASGRIDPSEARDVLADTVVVVVELD